MLLMDTQTSPGYLCTKGLIARDERVEIRELSGGVSNVVLYVARHNRDMPDFVLKQAREQLRVPEPWFCSVERIWREVDVLRICHRVLTQAGNAPPADGPPSDSDTAGTPRILFEDRDNYLFVMSAAPHDHTVWKRQLLDVKHDRSESDGRIAAACGQLLGKLHARTWRDAGLCDEIGDRQIFEELRIDPYYRKVAQVHEPLRPAIERLINSVFSHPLCLVHADFSPKNLLVYRGGMMMVDFETGHFGDPAFDLGFFLAHLVLKAFYHAPNHEPYAALADTFYKAYGKQMLQAITRDEYKQLMLRGNQNLAGCLLARLDGKSQVEYLTDDVRRERVRDLCRAILRNEPATWEHASAMCHQYLVAVV